jgi:hypothetical protein
MLAACLALRFFSAAAPPTIWGASTGYDVHVRRGSHATHKLPPWLVPKKPGAARATPWEAQTGTLPPWEVPKALPTPAPKPTPAPTPLPTPPPTPFPTPMATFAPHLENWAAVQTQHGRHPPSDAKAVPAPTPAPAQIYYDALPTPFPTPKLVFTETTPQPTRAPTPRPTPSAVTRAAQTAPTQVAQQRVGTPRGQAKLAAPLCLRSLFSRMLVSHACPLVCAFAPALPAVDSSVVLEGIDLASFDRRRAIFLASLALALAIPARTIHIHEVALGAYGGVEIQFKVVADVTRARNIARRMALHNFSRGLSSAIHIPSHNILAGGATVVSNLRANSFAAEASFLSKQSTATQPQPAPTQPPPNDMAIVLGSPLLAGLGFLVVTLFGLLVAQIMEQQQQLRGTTPLDSDV